MKFIIGDKVRVISTIRTFGEGEKWEKEFLHTILTISNIKYKRYYNVQENVYTWHDKDLEQVDIIPI